MSVGHKSANTQVFRLMLHHRGLHPELFSMQGRRIFRHGGYEAEAWMVDAGHVLRFQFGTQCLTESVLESSDHLPETGLIYALPCLGEKDYEMDPQGDLGYVTTIQTESLTDNLYTATFREMRDFAQEAEGLFHEWQDEEGNPCLSLLDVQKYRKEFHLQSYHLIGSTGMVLRTQSIFEVK